MKSLLLICIFLWSKSSFGQDSSLVVDAGVKVNDLLPSKIKYQYSEFLNGKVYYKEGNVSEGKLNYNRLMDEMHFISERGDTLALDNEATINFVSIGKDTFYFDRGFFMLIKNTRGLKLAVKQSFTVTDIKNKAAAYNMTSSTSSVSSLSSFDDGTVSHGLTVKGQLRLSEKKQYYLGDLYSHFVLVNRKNVLDFFPGCALQLNSYIKKNKIDFAKRNDVDQMMCFLEQNCQR